jgi:thiamine biosynthesis lipoprotein ApbE
VTRDSHNLQTSSVSFAALGTTATVLVTPPDPAKLDAARTVVALEVMDMDRAASRFRDDSELAEVNRRPGHPVTLSPLLLEAVEAALRGARLTDGMVDPTIGAAIRLLGYDRDFGAVDPDGPPLRLAARRVPGWRLVTVDRSTGSILIPESVELDLGATGKALATDRSARAAAEATGTGTGVLVSLGGDIAVAGSPPPQGWPVRVTDNHAGPLDAPGQTVTIRSGALATSSTTVRRWKRGDVIIHHLVDPRTGQPPPPWWRTVSVTAATCVDANTAATAAIILGEDAVAWLAGLGMPGRLVSVDGRVQVVGGWPAEP